MAGEECRIVAKPYARLEEPEALLGGPLYRKPQVEGLRMLTQTLVETHTFDPAAHS